MSKVAKVKALTAAFAVLFLMNSCTDFFSSSWGDMFKRDPDKVKVTASNVYELLNAAKGDPELSKAILNKINASSEPTLKLAAIKAANQAAGISTLALENVQALIDAADNNDTHALENLAKTIQADLRNNGIVGIADRLTAILGNETDYSKAPSVALKYTGNVTVPVSSNSNGPGVIRITVGLDGKYTATISFDNEYIADYSYPCTIKDDGTIILAGAGQYGSQDATIKYELDSSNHLVLSDLGGIRNAGLANESGASTTQILSPPVGKPEFTGDFAAGVSESDLTLLVMTLILAKVEKLEQENIDLDTYLNSWSGKNVGTGEGFGELDPDEKLIAATVNEMIRRGELTSDENELTKMLKDLLGMNQS